MDRPASNNSLRAVLREKAFGTRSMASLTAIASPTKITWPVRA